MITLLGRAFGRLAPGGVVPKKVTRADNARVVTERVFAAKDFSTALGFYAKKPIRGFRHGTAQLHTNYGSA